MQIKNNIKSLQKEPIGHQKNEKTKNEKIQMNNVGGPDGPEQNISWLQAQLRPDPGPDDHLECAERLPHTEACPWAELRSSSPPTRPELGQDGDKSEVETTSVGVESLCTAPPPPYQTEPALGGNLGGQKKETSKNNIHNFVTKRDSPQPMATQKFEKTFQKTLKKLPGKGAMVKKAKPIEEYFTIKLKPVITKNTELEKMRKIEKEVAVSHEPNSFKDRINFFKKMTSAEEQGPPLLGGNKFGKYTLKLKRKYPSSESES